LKLGINDAELWFLKGILNSAEILANNNIQKLLKVKKKQAFERNALAKLSAELTQINEFRTKLNRMEKV